MATVPNASRLQPGNGYRLPAHAYHAHDFFEEEQRRLFRRTWNFVGETRDLPEPGDFLTAEVGGEPLLLIRGEDGLLRAFHNVCRHRGVKLLDDRGHCRTITCPYHRWQYGLDGSLRNVPQQATQLPNLEASQWGLLPVTLASWRGLLFVNPDGTAPPFEDWFAGLPEQIGRYRPDTLVELVRGTYEFESNWKFYIENHLDWYHLWYTHPESLRMWDHHAGRMTMTGPHWTSFEPARPNAGALTPPLADIDGLTAHERQLGAHLIFPNLTLFTGAGYFATGLVEPLSPGRSRMHFRALVAAGQAPTSATAAALLEAFREITEDEDAAMTRRLQAAVRSSAFGVGPMTLDHEAPIARFHDAFLDVFEPDPRT